MFHDSPIGGNTFRWNCGFLVRPTCGFLARAPHKRNRIPYGCSSIRFLRGYVPTLSAPLKRTRRIHPYTYHEGGSQKARNPQKLKAPSLREVFQWKRAMHELDTKFNERTVSAFSKLDPDTTKIPSLLFSISLFRG